MAPDQGPDNRLPEQMPKKKGAFLVALLCLAIPAMAAARNSVREMDRTPVPPHGVEVNAEGVWLMPCVATRKTMPCPHGVTCLYAIHDGPDGFPNSVLRPDCWQELVLPVPDLEEVVGLSCQSSVEECIAKKDETCSARYPAQPGAGAVQLHKVTKFEAGRACQFVCVDREGVEHGLECVIQPSKPKPKPGQVALTP